MGHCFHPPKQARGREGNRNAIQLMDDDIPGRLGVINAAR